VSTKPFAITLGVGTSLANKTGSWRVERPVYVERLPPCNGACPAHEDIQGWLYEAEEGNYEAAWRLLMRANPLPAVMGRACFHPCETSCNRVQIDEAVGINAVERFLGDRAIAQGWRVPVEHPPTGKRVLVVGSGPAGLSAAYHLALLGHEVEVHEAAPRAGGMLRYGIPQYRLPRDVVDAEVARIAAMGVTFVLSSPVGHVGPTMTAGHFDAAFVGIGAQRGKNPEIPSGDAAKVLDAVSMLHGFEEGEGPVLGRRVVVYGGGDTAMDAARTAQRLGASETIVVYRRTRDRMPAHDEEVLDAQAEGVQMRWLSTVTRADGGRLMLEKMVLNADGQAESTGEFEELEADSLILALGQDTDLGLLDDLGDVDLAGGVINVDAHQMTGRPGVFAGGDASGNASERTVTAAVGHGARAAAAIDAWLDGRSVAPAPEHAPATVERLNSWYYADAPRTMRPRLEAIRRRSNFDEVVGGLTAEDALFEARRCMSCGNCFECDNCFGVCPDNAVIKLGPGLRYEFNFDYCKGCGICAKECPCGAIDMVPEHH
jgi:2-oxoacid:acceptor oxidoreductase delta subunit (pyruvate/2-ketoisovalerate family)